MKTSKSSLLSINELPVAFSFYTEKFILIIEINFNEKKLEIDIQELLKALTTFELPR